MRTFKITVQEQDTDFQKEIETYREITLSASELRALFAAADVGLDGAVEADALETSDCDAAWAALRELEKTFTA